VCTIKDQRAVLVCDLAIDRVRQEVVAVFGERVSFSHIDFQPTLVEAMPDVDAERFIAIVLAASAAAQAHSAMRLRRDIEGSIAGPGGKA
jgi:hypothetical protein